MQRQTLPPHSNPADSDAYLAACSLQERQLVQLAIDQLGSSYFMEKSHGYLAWKKSSASAAASASAASASAASTTAATSAAKKN